MPPKVAEQTKKTVVGDTLTQMATKYLPMDLALGPLTYAEGDEKVNASKLRNNLTKFQTELLAVGIPPENLPSAVLSTLKQYDNILIAKVQAETQ